MRLIKRRKRVLYTTYILTRINIFTPVGHRKSVSAHFLRSGRGLVGSKWHRQRQICAVWPALRAVQAISSYAQKNRFWGSKIEKLFWVQKGQMCVWGTISGVQKRFRTFFEVGARSGWVQTAHQNAGYRLCSPTLKKLIFGVENRKTFWGPGRSNMCLGDHIRCPKAFPHIF